MPRLDYSEKLNSKERMPWPDDYFGVKPLNPQSCLRGGNQGYIERRGSYQPRGSWARKQQPEVEQ